MKLRRNQNGFTLVELLLSVALLAIILLLGSPISYNIYLRNDLDITASNIVQANRRAQALSQAHSGDSSWGVYIQSGSITIYKGTSYSARDTDFDEITEVSNALTPSGVQEILYSKFDGEPQTTGSIILTSSNNETRTITIAEKGMVSY